MKSKEEILRKIMEDAYEKHSGEKAPIGRYDFYHDIRTFHVMGAMDIHAEQVAIEFFKWYALKMVGFIEYLNKVKPMVTSNEIEEKLIEFEGKSFIELFQLFKKEQEK